MTAKKIAEGEVPRSDLLALEEFPMMKSVTSQQLKGSLWEHRAGWADRQQESEDFSLLATRDRILPACRVLQRSQAPDETAT